FKVTLFIPHNAFLHRPLLDPFLFPCHVVSQQLPFSDLLLLSRCARLPTLLTAKTIFVTDNSPANFSLNHTPFTHPDLFSTPSLVHNVQSFLDYSLGSRLNDVVLLPLFSFVLPLCQGFFNLF
ncbi:hypothetical protein V8G54_017504, partial [Vigna mungo]